MQDVDEERLHSNRALRLRARFASPPLRVSGEELNRGHGASTTIARNPASSTSISQVHGFAHIGFAHIAWTGYGPGVVQRLGPALDAAYLRRWATRLGIAAELEYVLSP